MSCMFLDIQTYTNCFVTLSKLQFYPDADQFGIKRISNYAELLWHKAMRAEGERTIDIDPLQYMFQELHEINGRAYAERYQHRGEEYQPSGEVLDRNEGEVVSLCQLLKHLECIDYQCSDWSGWKRSDWKVALDTTREAIRNWIIHELPDYRTAAWA